MYEAGDGMAREKEQEKEEKRWEWDKDNHWQCCPGVCEDNSARPTVGAGKRVSRISNFAPRHRHGPPPLVLNASHGTHSGMEVDERKKYATARATPHPCCRPARVTERESRLA